MWRVLPGQLEDYERVDFGFETEQEANASVRGHAELGIVAVCRLLDTDEDGVPGKRWCVVVHGDA